MGMRLALGSTSLRLRDLLLRQGLLSVAIGAAVGVVGAMLSGRVLNSLVAGAQSINLATLTLSMLFVFFIAAASIWLATRRISGLDIMDVLRTE